MKTLFEAVYREANKARFLEPLYSVYKTVVHDCPIYSDLLDFINTHNELSFDWQSRDREKLFRNIINTYNDYKRNGGSNKNKKLLTYKDPNLIFTNNDFNLKYSKSKDEPIEEDTDLVIYPELETDKFIFVTPLTYEAAVFMDSFDCGGEGAQWCIGQDDSIGLEHWQEYEDDGDFFILAFNKEKYRNKEDKSDNKLKFMIQMDETYTKAWIQEDTPEDCIKEEKFKRVFGYSSEELLRAARNRNIFKFSLYISDSFKNGTYKCTIKDNSNYIDIIQNTNTIIGDFSGIHLDCEKHNLNNAVLNIGNKSHNELDLVEFLNWIDLHLIARNDISIKNLYITNASISRLIWNTDKLKSNFINNIYFYKSEIDYLLWNNDISTESPYLRIEKSSEVDTIIYNSLNNNLDTDTLKLHKKPNHEEYDDIEEYLN